LKNLLKLYNMKPLRYMGFSILLYAVMVLFYISLGQDITFSNCMMAVFPIVVLLWLGQYAVGENLFSLANIPQLFIGISWCGTFTLLYSLSYQQAWFISNVYTDFLFGISLCVFLVAGANLLLSCRYGGAKLRIALLSLCYFATILIPLIEWSYYLIYHHCLTPATIMALYLTNPNEAVDFIQSKVGMSGIGFILCVLLLFFAAVSWCSNRTISNNEHKRSSVYQKIVLGILTLFVPIYAGLCLFPKTSIMTNWNEVSDYVQETQEYGARYEERFADLQLSAKSTLAQKAPGTVIMVIGESASRNYMKAYTPNVSYENTPWLERCMQDSHFVVFNNVYSSWVQTVPVLERALTEESQYNDKSFVESTSILDVAKKAGYETYWFSNQGRYGQYDSAITLVAKTADHAEWTDDSYVFTDKVDGDLLSFLPKVDPTQNNFIVLHIMGSHIYYNNRYPAEFEKWKSEQGVSVEDAYANSTLYTDYVLSQIYDYAKTNLHLQAMVYYSDHGEDVNISHNPDVFKFNMVRIPMFVYLSKEYQAAYPKQAAVLQKNRSQFFTNDMIYDTVCGILNAPSNHYDIGQDFSSAEYRFNQENLTTMLGQKKLTEDPFLEGVSE
jgi:heptose-I-phosphate ethanolaminephosphotransferase